MSLFLGIDTSNYTTSAAVYNSQNGEMLGRKQLLPVKEGQLGLRQSDAVFHHTQQLHLLIEDIAKEIDLSAVSVIGVSTRPRPVDGSYMPCFTVGENTARIISSVIKKPLLTFSHQEGHIAAALFSSGRDDLFNEQFLAFHVSGGTTEAVLAKGSVSSFEVEEVAKTLDLNAGQAVDRVGLMLGLKFPCGAELERLALKNTQAFKVRPTLKGADCCLSGLENQCRKMLSNGESREKISAFCLAYIESTIEKMTDVLLQKHGCLPVLYAGGVMSDSIIRDALESRFNAVFAKPEYSSDNAAGIAYLAYKSFSK